MAILGSFHLPAGMSNGDHNALLAQIAKGGVYNAATKEIIVKNGSGETAEELFRISVAEIPKMFSGDAASVGTTVTIGEDGSVKVDLDTDYVKEQLGYDNHGFAHVNENGKLVEDAITYVDGENASHNIASKFAEVLAAITANSNSIAALTGAYVYIGTIDNDAPTATELTAQAAVLLGDKALVAGHVIVDTQGIEWWYDGSTWVNLGQTIIAIATADTAGVVKGSDDVEIGADGSMTVKHAADADKLGGVAAENYALKTYVDDAVAGASCFVFGATAAVADADADKLAAFTTAKNGDIAIITKTTDGTAAGTVVSVVSYVYYENDWHAMCGKLSAEDIILAEDIVLAGSYTQVGNITKGANETKTLSYKGKTLGSLISEIFTKTLQPADPTKPTISGLTITSTPAAGTLTSDKKTYECEAGTEITSMSWSGITFSDGTYTYGPEPTGSTATGYTVKRNNGSTSTNVGTAVSGTDDNDGKGFVIGDKSGDFSTLTYKATATYSDGNVAKDNRGNASNPEKKITAGTTAEITASTTYKSIRKVFYGTTTTTDIDFSDFANKSDEQKTAISNAIRGLSSNAKSTGNGQTFSLKNTDSTTKRMIFAYPATSRDVNAVKYVENSNSEVKGTFTKYTVQVAGVDGYNPIDYKVYVYEAVGGITARTYSVTI